MAQSFDLFLIHTHSIGDFIQCYGFKYYLYIDDSQVYIFSSNQSPELRLLYISIEMSNSYLKFNIFRTLLQQLLYSCLNCSIHKCSPFRFMVILSFQVVRLETSKSSLSLLFFPSFICYIQSAANSVCPTFKNMSRS